MFVFVYNQMYIKLHPLRKSDIDAEWIMGAGLSVSEMERFWSNQNFCNAVT